MDAVQYLWFDVQAKCAGGRVGGICGYSFFIEGKSTSVTSTAFEAGPHFTENNIYVIIIQYIQYFTIYMIVNLIHGIKNRFLGQKNK